MCKIYVDTCVYRDLFEGRKDKFRDLAEFAIFTFNQVREGKYKLVVSDWVLDEFKKHCDKKKINEFLEGFEKDQIIKIIRTPEDKKRARELSPNNYPDALHVILALKSNCLCLVTQNIQDFAEFQDLIEIVIPESL
jgi:predicted nucleic acid-binding protein